MKVLTLCIALFLDVPMGAMAQTGPPPCGTITRNTKLKGDCMAPLNVGADNITIDLNGFTVRGGSADEPHGDIDLVNKSGVTIKNGRVAGGSSRSIHIDGGRLNRITNMTLLVPVLGRGIGLYRTSENVIQKLNIISLLDSYYGIQINESHQNRIDRVTIEGRDFGIGFIIVGDHNRITRSVIDRVSNTDGVLVLHGKGNAIERNDFRCDFYRGVWLFEGSENTLVRANSFSRCRDGIYVEGPGNKFERNTIEDSSRFGIYVASLANMIRLNRVLTSAETDMVDANPSCGTNTWRHNSFATDSEGDGPFSGCIR